MWARTVVVIAPGIDLAPRIEQIAEPTRVQTFLTQAAVETLYVRVLDRLAGPDVNQCDALVQGPRQKRAAGELRPVIAADPLWRAPLGDDSIQDPKDTQAAQGRVRLQRKALTRKHVHDRNMVRQEARSTSAT
jgi:hypothetical protein